MKNKVLAIVGAGQAALPIIEKAKEMNIKTIGFGGADSIAKNEVDLFIEKSIFDIDALYKECIRLDVSGVIASSEVTTESAALLANKLRLPGNSVCDGFFARNKYLMRKKVSQLMSVKQPKFSLYGEHPITDFPVVVKSVDACGKRGVSLIKNEGELKEAVLLAQKYSSDGSALIEEYIEGGQEYSVECLVSANVCTIVQITEKETSGPPHFAEIGHHQPANISYEIEKKIKNITKEILCVLGITCGMAHLELKVCDNDIYFIEVAARAGGDHIADTLTILSTDCDYYRAAIECSFGACNKNLNVKNKAHSGIYFHCVQNKRLVELFDKAKTANWCIKDTIVDLELPEISTNCEAIKAGYFIYCSDHKIDIRDSIEDRSYEAIKINDYNNAFELVWQHNKEIGRNLTDEELRVGIDKFLQQGNVIAILDGNHITAFLILYCNNFKTLDAYVCNVYVLEKFRGRGLSKKVVEKAISICYQNSFKRILLHVAEENTTAISLYKNYGFNFTGETKTNGEKQLEMALIL